MNYELRTPLEELNLTDRFLFAETMDKPEAYEAVVGILLEDEIELSDHTQTEKELRVSPKLRTVRLDVVSMDKDGQIYFTEMQKTDTGNLLKRSRYYQAQLDVSLLEPGSKNFNRLNDSCMILVAPFDLFGYGLYRYTFTGQCKEIPGLVLRDGATRSKSRRVKLVHSKVEQIRRSEKCGVKYMQRWEEIAYARQDGYEEGRNEGRDEGRSEGALREIIAAVCKKLAKRKSIEQMGDELEQESELITRICHVAEKYAPDYDRDAIYQEMTRET